MGYDDRQFSLGFDYNAYGQLSRIRTSKTGTWATLASHFLYQQATGKRYAWRFNNTIPRLTALDTDGRVSSIYSMNAVNQEYEYHVTDTVSKIKDNVYPVLSQAPSYNLLDRVANNGSAADAQGFYWDAGGNRAAHRLEGVEYQSTIDPASNRLKEWKSTPDARQWRSFEYDGQGNLFRETGNSGTRTYEYDSFFRLGGIKAGASVRAYFSNNAFNQRAVKNTYAAGAIHYIYGMKGELLAEYNGAVRTYYIWLDGQLLAIERNGQLHASHNDRTGRPVKLLDAAARTVWRAANAVFDRRVEFSSIGNMNIGFPGQYYDAETGLWYNWHRYFDASLGRYLQNEPVQSMRISSPYTYADGNPLVKADPDGLQAIILPPVGPIPIPALPLPSPIKPPKPGGASPPPDFDPWHDTTTGTLSPPFLQQQSPRNDRPGCRGMFEACMRGANACWPGVKQGMQGACLAAYFICSSTGQGDGP